MEEMPILGIVSTLLSWFILLPVCFNMFLGIVSMLLQWSIMFQVHKRESAAEKSSVLVSIEHLNGMFLSFLSLQNISAGDFQNRHEMMIASSLRGVICSQS